MKHRKENYLIYIIFLIILATVLVIVCVQWKKTKEQRRDTFLSEEKMKEVRTSYAELIEFVTRYQEELVQLSETAKKELDNIKDIDEFDIDEVYAKSINDQEDADLIKEKLSMQYRSTIRSVSNLIYTYRIFDAIEVNLLYCATNGEIENQIGREYLNGETTKINDYLYVLWHENQRT